MTRSTIPSGGQTGRPTKRRNSKKHKITPGMQKLIEAAEKALFLEVKDEKAKSWYVEINNTTKNYYCMMRQLFTFCFTVGDVDSTLILSAREYKGGAIPSMNPETLCLFLRYKYLPKDVVLTGDDGEVIMDRETKLPIRCTDEWKTPRQAETFRAAITKLHERRLDTKAEFIDVCPECLEARLDSDGNSKGCRIHSFNPILVRRGNPANSSKFRAQKDKILKDKADYQEMGASYWSPHQVRLVRNYCLGLNSLDGLSMITMILVSIFLFLRFDEFHRVMIEDFITILHMVNEAGHIGSLGVKVKGKSDARKINLVLYMMNDCPDLCPVRHLLVYVYLSGIKTGPLFPKETLDNPKRLAEIGKGNGKGSAKKNTKAYSTLLSAIKSLFYDIGQVPRSWKIGLHSARKTAYIFAIFGGGSNDDISKGARHKSDRNAQSYRQDVRTIKALRELSDSQLNNKVPKWRSNFLTQETVDQKVTSFIGHNELTLVDLAKKFVEEDLGIKDPKLHYPAFLIEKAINYKGPMSVKDEVSNLLGRFNLDGNTGLCLGIQSLLSRAQREASTAAPPVPPPYEPPTVVVTPSRSPSHGQFDVASRGDLKKKQSLREQMNALVEWSRIVPEDRKEWQEKFRKWYGRWMEPNLNCLKNHYNGNVDAFCAAHDNVKLKKDCRCSGTGSQCCAFV